MKIAIVCSKTDEASSNIYSFLKDRIKPEIGEHEVSLHFMDEDSVYLENIDKELGADRIIFPTKHQSKSGIHSLSVHVQGNWGSEARFGGKPSQLGIAPAGWLKEGLRLLEEKGSDMKYDVIQECTHHGPYLEVPSIFIEIGSSEKEWKNPEAGKAISDTIIKLLEKDIPKYRTAVGIGGLHHTPNFKRIMLESDIAIGHVCPKYMLEEFNREMLLQALEKTVPKADLVLVDWKGLGKHKQKVLDILDSVDVEWDKRKNF